MSFAEKYYMNNMNGVELFQDLGNVCTKDDLKLRDIPVGIKSSQRYSYMLHEGLKFRVFAWLFFFLLGFISVFCGTQVQVICGGWRAVNILSLYNGNRLLVKSVWKLYWSQILAFSVNFLVFYYVKSWYLKISPPGALLHLAVSALQQ